jgi:hypothetical protein
MVRKQQMRWTQPRAHRLLQVRTHVLNEGLRRTFERWYPGLKPDIESPQDPAAQQPVWPGLPLSSVGTSL